MDEGCLFADQIQEEVTNESDSLVPSLHTRVEVDQQTVAQVQQNLCKHRDCQWRTRCDVCVHSETCMCLKMVLHSSAVMMPFRDRGPAKFCSEREQLLNQQLNTHFPSHNLVQSV